MEPEPKWVQLLEEALQHLETAAKIIREFQREISAETVRREAKKDVPK